MSDVIEKSIFN